MAEVVDDRQRLTFDDDVWHAVKWDDEPEFLGHLQSTFANLTPAKRTRGVKAADVTAVGSLNGRPVILIGEFKDFDHPNASAAERAKVATDAATHQLLTDVLSKLLDTMAGRTFAFDDDRASPQRASWRAALGDPDVELLLLLCVELPRTQVLTALAWQKALQRRLRWVGSNARVLVTTSHRPFADLGVAYGLVP